MPSRCTESHSGSEYEHYLNDLGPGAPWYGKCHCWPEFGPYLWSYMPKPPPAREPDPMAGVVDRLLAQLPGLRGGPEPFRHSPPRIMPQSPVTTATRAPVVSQGQLVGTWFRLLLALAFGVMMASWPYQRACGLPLLGYLTAVTVVVWSGALAATAAWRYRVALAHILSLILVLYGLMLAMAEVLPRTGYAMKNATWQCGEADAPYSWTASYRLNPTVSS
jgi:hypothetical protein